MMEVQFKEWALTGLAAVLLVLVIADIVLFQDNSNRQKEYASRQAVIQQTQQVDLPLYREIAQALTELARRGDTQIGYMLAAQGIPVPPPQTTANPAQPAAPAQPDASDTRPSRGRGRP